MERIITINENDKEIYEFIKHCKSEEDIKATLSNAIELYGFCNGGSGEFPGYFSPEKLKEKKLMKMSRKELLKYRKEFIKELLIFAQDFHPDEIDCGIMRGPEVELWFIDDSSRLGYIALYAQYIKVIDELLKNNKGAK